MNNTPEAIRTTLTEQVVRPLAEALTGNRPLAQVEALVSPLVWRLLSDTVLTPRPVRVVQVRAQALPGTAALEVAAVLLAGDDAHALALRLAVVKGRPVVVRVEAPSLL